MASYMLRIPCLLGNRHSIPAVFKLRVRLYYAACEEFIMQACMDASNMTYFYTSIDCMLEQLLLCRAVTTVAYSWVAIQGIGFGVNV